VYAANGLDSLAGVNGNWVVAIRDNANKAIVLSRDPVGIQMLYYALHGSLLCYATHLSALQELGVATQVDRTSVAQFLHFLYVPSPRTAFEGVSCVPVGKAVVMNREGISFRPLHARAGARYWKERRGERAEIGAAQALNTFDDMLTSAVLDRTSPTGRTVIFLSGGKDSASLCVAAAKIDTRRYLAVTVGFADESVDESGDAAMVARHLRMDHIVLRFTPEELADALEDFARVHGQPLGDPAGLPLCLAVKRLPSDIEMILDGTGNDAYMGIPLRRAEDLYLKFPLIRILARLLPSSFSRLLPEGARSLLRKFRGPLGELFVTWDGWSENEVRELLSLDPRLCETEMSRLCSAFAGGDGVELKTEAICRIWEPDTAYRKAAQSANYLDLPISYPFADSRLAGLFSTLPEAFCFRGRTSKVLLREYMSRHLPRRILEKPKGYFEFNTDTVLRVDRSGAARKFFADTMSHHRGVQMDEQISSIVRHYLRGDSSLRSRVYALALLSTWLELQSTRRASLAERVHIPVC
jgi:asparagine synthase (glutamine-hydrolysing)